MEILDRQPSVGPRSSAQHWALGRNRVAVDESMKLNWRENYLMKRRRTKTRFATELWDGIQRFLRHFEAPSFASWREK
jgi:hypothetical protein